VAAFVSSVRHDAPEVAADEPAGTMMRSTEPAEGGIALGNAPDYFEPLVAWRVWTVAREDGTVRLRSLYRSSFWPVGAPLEARCQSRRFRLWRRTVHEAPESTCTCGIYAVPPCYIPKRGGALPPGCTPVIGQVSLWGDVVECERGWRARFAYPARLYVPGVSAFAKEVAADLEDYGVPVELLDVESIAAAVETVAGRAA
jgi:hypothetical protein